LPEQFAEYLRTAGEQIRWKRARPLALSELRTHLLDQRDDCLAQGMTEEDAQAEALRQMGDPAAVGTELDGVHRPRPQWGPLLMTLAVALAGASLRVGLTAGWEMGLRINPITTAFALVLGTVALLGGYFLDYAFLGRHGAAVYMGTILASLLSLIFTRRIMGASYYTRYLILFYPLVYALWLYVCRGRGWLGLLAAIAGGVPLAVLACLAPSLSGLLVLLLTGAVLLTAAAAEDWFRVGAWRGMTAVCGTMVLLGGLSIWQFLPQGMARFYQASHPELDPLGAGYQTLRVREALTSAAWLGEGTWDEVYPYPYERAVPGCETDFFLTTVIHRLGWLPFLLLVLALGALLVWMAVRCLRQRNRLGRLAALAVVLPLGLRAVAALVLNLGFVLCSVSFPLVVGNLHTVVDMALIGVALSVFRQERLPEQHPAAAPEERRPLVSWRDGDLVIALGRRS